MNIIGITFIMNVVCVVKEDIIDTFMAMWQTRKTRNQSWRLWLNRHYRDRQVRTWRMSRLPQINADPALDVSSEDAREIRAEMRRMQNSADMKFLQSMLGHIYRPVWFSRFFTLRKETKPPWFFTKAAKQRFYDSGRRMPWWVPASVDMDVRINLRLRDCMRLIPRLLEKKRITLNQVWWFASRSELDADVIASLNRAAYDFLATKRPEFDLVQVLMNDELWAVPKYAKMIAQAVENGVLADICQSGALGTPAECAILLCNLENRGFITSDFRSPYDARGAIGEADSLATRAALTRNTDFFTQLLPTTNRVSAHA